MIAPGLYTFTILCSAAAATVAEGKAKSGRSRATEHSAAEEAVITVEHPVAEEAAITVVLNVTS